MAEFLEVQSYCKAYHTSAILVTNDLPNSKQTKGVPNHHNFFGHPSCKRHVDLSRSGNDFNSYLENWFIAAMIKDDMKLILCVMQWGTVTWS